MTTNSPASSSESQGFGLLDERIQRWIWHEGWTALRDAQERAIPALIDSDRDVIIAAATATGKTEAAFFPILTHLLRDYPTPGSVLYISPLKALINDQWGRLNSLCESLDIPVIGWHGDITANQKHKFLKNPNGILLITPESLEALFVTKDSSIPSLMANLRYVVVDELHAFIGSERGKQLQSLLHRVEQVRGHRVTRVGLSATLGDMRLAAHFLRPSEGAKVEIIETKGSNQELKILLKGYIEKPPPINTAGSGVNLQTDDLQYGSITEVAAHLYKVLRGSNNLVFPNSRQKVEIYTDLLRRHCERDSIPNEFWAHHGSLAKDYREEAEHALKSGERPATAVCTTTLELGIDIGSVKSICQIGASPSVASLRQRLGRSGRRKGEAAILRAYCIEPELTVKSSISDCLHEGLVQSIAMIQLLLSGWFEPPRIGGLHGSTLVQQILSIIAERGGATAAQLWSVLASPKTPFEGISREDFTLLLRNMGGIRLLTQDSSGCLLHGEVGEKIVNHYEFFAAFTSEEEFRLICDGSPLGSIPLSRPLLPQQRIIFTGRRWRVIDVDAEKKVIVVVPDKGGAPPAFDGGGAMVHDRVRQEMRSVLASDYPVSFLDQTAQSLLLEARNNYKEMGLGKCQLIQRGTEVQLLTWHGDWVNDALSLLFANYKLAANNEGLLINITGASEARVQDALDDISHIGNLDTNTILADAKNIFREKWDWAMPESMARQSYASLCLDLKGAIDLAAKFSRTNYS